MPIDISFDEPRFLCSKCTENEVERLPFGDYHRYWYCKYCGIELSQDDVIILDYENISYIDINDRVVEEPKPTPSTSRDQYGQNNQSGNKKPNEGGQNDEDTWFSKMIRSPDTYQWIGLLSFIFFLIFSCAIIQRAGDIRYLDDGERALILNSAMAIFIVIIIVSLVRYYLEGGIGLAILFIVMTMLLPILFIAFIGFGLSLMTCNPIILIVCGVFIYIFFKIANTYLD